MSRDVLEQAPSHAARCTLEHLCRQIVRVEARALIFARTGMSDRAEVMAEYLERLRTWHFYWVRGTRTHLERCTDCGYVQVPSPKVCPLCQAPWVQGV